jgi:vacuolar-type H+-ATPase subunit I/STV1
MEKTAKEQEFEKLKEESKQYDEVVDELKKKVDDLEYINRKNEDNAEKLSKLYEAGIIDADGQPIDQNQD